MQKLFYYLLLFSFSFGLNIQADDSLPKNAKSVNFDASSPEYSSYKNGFIPLSMSEDKEFLDYKNYHLKIFKSINQFSKKIGFTDMGVFKLPESPSFVFNEENKNRFLLVDLGPKEAKIQLFNTLHENTLYSQIKVNEQVFFQAMDVTELNKIIKNLETLENASKSYQKKYSELVSKQNYSEEEARKEALKLAINKLDRNTEYYRDFKNYKNSEAFLSNLEFSINQELPRLVAEIANIQLANNIFTEANINIDGEKIYSKKLINDSRKKKIILGLSIVGLVASISSSIPYITYIASAAVVYNALVSIKYSKAKLRVRNQAKETSQFVNRMFKGYTRNADIILGEMSPANRKTFIERINRLGAQYSFSGSNSCRFFAK